MKHETIDRFIKNKLTLQVRQHHDGRVQADIGDHHAQGPTLDMALERLEVYVTGLDHQVCYWHDDPDEGFKHYWRTGCGNHGCRTGYKSIPAMCPHCNRPAQ